MDEIVQRLPYEQGGTMIIQQVDNWIFEKFVKLCYQGTLKEFLAEFKILPDWSFRPVETDPDENFWWLGQRSVDRFLNLKKIYIDDVVAIKQSDADAGFTPLPRANNPLSFKRAVS